MWGIHPDDEGFEYTSAEEWDRAEARDIGAEHPDRAWILTDRDVWHANPFYNGPPVPHPESYSYDDYDTPAGPDAVKEEEKPEGWEKEEMPW